MQFLVKCRRNAQQTAIHVHYSIAVVLPSDDDVARTLKCKIISNRLRELGGIHATSYIEIYTLEFMSFARSHKQCMTDSISEDVRTFACLRGSAFSQPEAKSRDER